jgi:hypothetical protein
MYSLNTRTAQNIAMTGTYMVRNAAIMCAFRAYSDIKCREPRCGNCVRVSSDVRLKPRKRSRSLKPSDKERRNRSWRLSYEHLAAAAIASLEYRKVLVNFWSTFVQSSYPDICF